MGVRMWAAVAVGSVLLVLPAAAFGITIDGVWETAWDNPSSVNDDPQDVTGSPNPQGWDIDENLYIWGPEADGTQYMYFGITTYGLMDDANFPTYQAFAEILIDTDNNTATGIQNYHGMSGADYRLYAMLDAMSDGTAYSPGTTISDGSSTYTIFTVDRWDSNLGRWVALADPDALVARNDNNNSYTFVEWRVAASDLGNPAEFTWGAYLDNYRGYNDDNCPDDMDQGGYTPEPSSFALLLLGLPGLALWRRRRREEE